MSAINYLPLFNTHFIEFLEDIERIFPEDLDIKTAKNSASLLIKLNPTILIKMWKTHVNAKYQKEIEKGDIDFFINKDYTNDLVDTGNTRQITDAIDRLRNPIKLMTPEDQAKTMKYIQNLSKLSVIYETQG